MGTAKVLALGLAICLLLPTNSEAHDSGHAAIAILPFAIIAAIGAAKTRSCLTSMMGHEAGLTLSRNVTVSVAEVFLMYVSFAIALWVPHGGSDTEIEHATLYVYLLVAVVLQHTLIGKGRWRLLKAAMLALPYPILLCLIVYVFWGY